MITKKAIQNMLECWVYEFKLLVYDLIGLDLFGEEG